MNLKLIVILCIVLDLLWKMFLLALDRRSLKRAVPIGVIDVYDPDEYRKWRSYKAETNRLSLIGEAVGSVVLLLLVAFDVFAAFDRLFPEGIYARLWSVIVLMTVVTAVAEVPFEAYSTFVIEAKYGFNRSTVRTFIGDQIKGALFSTILMGGLATLLAAFHQSMGDWVIVLFAGTIVLFMLALSALMPAFTRIFNKFVPLADGELKDKLTALMEGHGYKVRAIEVMDASRRSTKANAYFTGLGPTKTIVLYDTLIDSASPDEICAIFAHEMGHGLHHDMLRTRLFSVLSSLVMAVAVWLCVRTEALYPALGFTTVNYGMALVLMGWLMSIVEPLMSFFSSYSSRKAEYAADAQAVAEGYGEALISGLRSLSKKNMADLSPDPLLVKLTYSHPTLDQRITAIRKLSEGRKDV